MELNEIERLIAKNKLTREEKATVKAEADRLGIDYTLKQGCASCWEKLLLKLYDAHRADVTAAVSVDGYRLKNPLHAFQTYNGEVFSNDTVKEKIVGRLHQFILREYFVKVEEPETEKEPETQTETDADNSEI